MLVRNSISYPEIVAIHGYQTRAFPPVLHLDDQAAMVCLDDDTAELVCSRCKRLIVKEGPSSISNSQLFDSDNLLLIDDLDQLRVSYDPIQMWACHRYTHKGESPHKFIL